MKVRSFWAVLTIGLALVGTTEPLLAHHSTAMYDMAAPVTVTGVVTSGH